MKTILIAITLMLGLTGFGQKVKMEVDKVDDMTGSTIKLTKSYKIASGFSRVWAVSLERQNDVKKIHIHINGYNGCSGTVDGKAIVKLQDGTNITLKETSKVDCGTYKVFTYLLPDEVINGGQNIDKIRIYTSSDYIEEVWAGKIPFTNLLNAVK
tara:strand:+ start:133 stop:597 length:465 start_codon:yes stop_codon:yes gene_type:complete